jgi:hypothetical protein
MGERDVYGKDVMRGAVGSAFQDRGAAVLVSHRVVPTTQAYGVIVDKNGNGLVAVEIESRTAKQVRGALAEPRWHPAPHKVMVLIPMYMHDVRGTAAQCRQIWSGISMHGTCRWSC